VAAADTAAEVVVASTVAEVAFMAVEVSAEAGLAPCTVAEGSV
jgi:hypothetical protein